MDTQTLLILLAIAACVAIAGLFTAFIIRAFKRQARRSIYRSVEATITQIQVEAGAVSSWWMVTAEWRDPVTGRIRTFRSRPLKFPPQRQIGERIAVYFEVSRPEHYYMHL